MTNDRSSTSGGRSRRGGRARAGEPRVVARRPASAEATAAGDAPAEEEQPRGGRRRGRPSGEAAAAPEEQKPKRAPRRRSAAKAAADTTPAAADTAPADQEAVRTAEPAKTTTQRGSRAKTAAAGGTLETQVAALSESIADVRRAVEALGEQVDRAARHARLGVFVDVPNLLYGGERVDIPIDVGKLLDYLSKGRDLVRATAYSPVSDDPSEPTEQQRFVAPFVPHSYRIVTKPLKRFSDGSIKGNFDVEMAIDMVTMAERLDVIAVVSGDADFARVVEMVQSRGVRVEVVAFANSTSAEMRALADAYIELGSIAKQIGA